MSDIDIILTVAGGVKLIGNHCDPYAHYNVYSQITGMTGVLRRARAALQESPGNDALIAEIEKKLIEIKRFKRRADRQ